MNFRFETCAEKIIAGLPVFGKPDSGIFTKAWDMFIPIMDKIPNVVSPELCYGVEWYTNEFMQTGEMFYMPGVEISDTYGLPTPFAIKIIPAAEFVVFEAVGGIKGIHQVWDYFHSTWKNEHGYDIAIGIDYELYDERFKGIDNPETIIEIHIPIQKI